MYFQLPLDKFYGKIYGLACILHNFRESFEMIPLLPESVGWIGEFALGKLALFYHLQKTVCTMMEINSCQEFIENYRLAQMDLSCLH